MVNKHSHTWYNTAHFHDTFLWNLHLKAYPVELCRIPLSEEFLPGPSFSNVSCWYICLVECSQRQAINLITYLRSMSSFPLFAVSVVLYSVSSGIAVYNLSKKWSSGISITNVHVETNSKISNYTWRHCTPTLPDCPKFVGRERGKFGNDFNIFVWFIYYLFIEQPE